MEKRNLSILFCDILGSTNLADSLPMVDFVKLIKSYQACVEQEITLQYGYIAQYLGDGILAYFGYPMTFEGTSVRAIQAGLNILSALDKLETAEEERHEVNLRTRISIHTGPVIITDVGRADRREKLALGGTPNVAARLQRVAPEDGIAVSEVTYLEAHDHFEFRPLGSHLFKGLSSEMKVFQPIQSRT